MCAVGNFEGARSIPSSYYVVCGGSATVSVKNLRRDGMGAHPVIRGGCIYLNECHCRVAAQGAPRAWLRTVRVRRFTGGVGRAGRGRGVPCQRRKQ